MDLSALTKLIESEQLVNTVWTSVQKSLRIKAKWPLNEDYRVTQVQAQTLGSVTRYLITFKLATEDDKMLRDWSIESQIFIRCFEPKLSDGSQVKAYWPKRDLEFEDDTLQIPISSCDDAPEMLSWLLCNFLRGVCSEKPIGDRERPKALELCRDTLKRAAERNTLNQDQTIALLNEIEHIYDSVAPQWTE